MPELPHQRRQRYLGLGLSMYDVLVLSDDVSVATYFDGVLAAGAPAKPAANWVMGDVMAHCKVRFACVLGTFMLRSTFIGSKCIAVLAGCVPSIHPSSEASPACTC
jgi:Asp-tRNA(Asn)/Glu-tRNA(Gln) amidotransferase B subunit